MIFIRLNISAIVIVYKSTMLPYKNLTLYYRHGKILAAELGCDFNTTRFHKEVMSQADCLRKLPIETIIYNPGTFGRSKLGPKGTQAVIDGGYSDNPFLPKSTRNGLKLGEYNTNVDMLLGSNKDDGLEFTAQLHHNHSLLKLYKDRWLDPDFNFGAQNLFIVDDFKHVEKSMIEMVEKVTNFYLGDIEYLSIVNITHFTMMYTDAWYFFAAYDFISKHLPNMGKDNNIYQYHYTHQGEHSLSVELGLGGPYGVGHCDETFLQFHPYMNKLSTRQLSNADKVQSSMLVKSWKNFIKTGNPSTEIVLWSPIKSTADRSYLNIKMSSSMEYSSDVATRMEFWDDLINSQSTGNRVYKVFWIFDLFILVSVRLFQS